MQVRLKSICGPGTREQAVLTATLPPPAEDTAPREGATRRLRHPRGGTHPFASRMPHATVKRKARPDCFTVHSRSRPRSSAPRSLPRTWAPVLGTPRRLRPGTLRTSLLHRVQSHGSGCRFPFPLHSASSSLSYRLGYNPTSCS